MIAWTMNKGWCLLWKCSCQTVSETAKHADHFAHTLWHVWHASDSVNGAIVYAWKANIRAYTPKNLLYIHFVYMLYIHSCRTSSLWHQLAVDKTETVIPGGVYSPVFFKLQYENLTSGSSSLIDMFASPLTACLFFSSLSGQPTCCWTEAVQRFPQWERWATGWMEWGPCPARRPSLGSATAPVTHWPKPPQSKATTHTDTHIRLLCLFMSAVFTGPKYQR